MKKLDKQGFTVIELMIAIAVFSTVLVICAASMITIGRQLRKAETSISTQNTTRSIIEEVSRQVELSAEPPSFGAGVICVGSVRYSYALDTQVENSIDAAKNQGLHGLWRDILLGSSPCAQANLGVANPTGSNGGDPGQPGQELLPLHTRLARFSVLNGTNVAGVFRPYQDTRLWDVDIAVVFGDNDLIINRGTANEGCISSTAGGSFCALSQSHTAVFRRIQ